MTMYSFPGSLANAIQDGYLEAEFRSGLAPQLAYARFASLEDIQANAGVKMTMIRHGRKAPVTTPTAGSVVNSNLDNGMTPTQFAIEQFELELQNYQDTADVNLKQQAAGIRKQSLVTARNSGLQGIQSKERIARNKIFQKYMGGNTRVRGGTPTTTTCKVDDIRGFDKLVVNGQLVTVSASNYLLVDEINASTGAVVQQLQVTGVAADGTNVSLAKDAGGISGTLTFNTATEPTNDNFLKASNASVIMRPNSRLGTSKLVSGDKLTIDLVLDAVARLRDNAIPAFEETGLYRCVLDNTCMRHLLTDTTVRAAYEGQLGRSQEVRSGLIFELFGVEFITTNEAPVQVANSGAGQVVGVRRPTIIGGECLVESNWLGLPEALADMADGISEIYEMDQICLVIRPPMDRQAQLASFSWQWTGDYACPSDLTATKDVIQTADENALHKRAIVLEVAA